MQEQSLAVVAERMMAAVRAAASVTGTDRASRVVQYLQRWVRAQTWCRGASGSRGTTVRVWIQVGGVQRYAKVRKEGVQAVRVMFRRKLVPEPSSRGQMAVGAVPPRGLSRQKLWEGWRCYFPR